jgi:hypothetical protein
MPPLILLIVLWWWIPLPLPVPLFLLWPFLGLAILVTKLAGILPSRTTADERGAPLVKTTISAYCHLSGLMIRVRSSDGFRICVWVI